VDKGFRRFGCAPKVDIVGGGGGTSTGGRGRRSAAVARPGTPGLGPVVFPHRVGRFRDGRCATSSTTEAPAYSSAAGPHHPGPWVRSSTGLGGFVTVAARPPQPPDRSPPAPAGGRGRRSAPVARPDDPGLGPVAFQHRVARFRDGRCATSSTTGGVPHHARTAARARAATRQPARLWPSPGPSTRLRKATRGTLL